MNRLQILALVLVLSGACSTGAEPPAASETVAQEPESPATTDAPMAGDSTDPATDGETADSESGLTAEPVAASLQDEDLVNGAPITREPFPVVVGDTITVRLLNWKPGSTVSVYIDHPSNSLGDYQADSAGAVDAALTIPKATAGVHELVFDGTPGRAGWNKLGFFLDFPGLPKVGDTFGTYVCCFEGRPGPLDTSHRAQVIFVGIEFYTTWIDEDGGFLVRVPTFPNLGDPVLTFELINLNTGETIDFETPAMPSDPAVGWTIRRVIVNLRDIGSERLDQAVADLEDAFGRLELDPLHPAEIDRMFSLDFESLDPEDQEIVDSFDLDSVDVDAVLALYAVDRESDRLGALLALQSAIAEVNRGQDDGSISPGVGDTQNDLLTAAARSLAYLMIQTAQPDTGAEQAVHDINALLEAGDIFRSNARYHDAVSAYLTAAVNAH